MNFQKWRLKLGLTKAKTRELLKISRQTIIDYDKGLRQPKASTIELMNRVEKEIKEKNAISREDKAK